MVSKNTLDRLVRFSSFIFLPAILAFGLSCKSPTLSEVIQERSKPRHKIVFVSTRDHQELYDMDLEGENERRLTYSKDLLSGVSCFDPKYSPDGNSILFRRSAGGFYIVDPDGKNQRRLGKLEGEYADWSQNGERIVYVSKEGELWTANSKSGEDKKRLADGTYKDSDPVWGLDGIYFVREYEDKSFELCFIKEDGSGFKRLTNDPDFDYFDPALSPDEKRLAYAKHSEEKAHVYVKSLDEKAEEIKISGGPLEDNINFNPVWSPDGREIIFVSVEEKGMLDIYASKSDGSTKENPRRLTENTSHNYMPDCSVVGK